MRLAIIANPVAGRGRPLRKLKAFLQRRPHPEWEVEIIETRGPEHATAIARDLLDNPPEIVCVCGGDGTLKEVVTGVPDPPFPVALLPAGTANVMGRELGLPLDPVRALDIALRRSVRRVDLGVYRARESGRFLLMAGIGFDAHAAARVRPALKARIGIAAYYLETIRTLISFPCTRFTVDADGEVLGATSCVVANARSYGGGLVLTPSADMRDGMFDLLVLDTARKADYFRFLLAARLGRSLDFPFVQRRRARLVRVSGPRGLWVQVDGEPIGTLPVELEVNPSAFPLVVPQ